MSENTLMVMTIPYITLLLRIRVARNAFVAIVRNKHENPPVLSHRKFVYLPIWMSVFCEKTCSNAAPMPSITYGKSRLMIMSVKAAPNAVRYFRSVVAGS